MDAERPVVFVCRVGARSFMAAQAFRRAGYRASSMAGGMERWVAADRPTPPRAASSRRTEGCEGARRGSSGRPRGEEILQMYIGIGTLILIIILVILLT